MNEQHDFWGDTPDWSGAARRPNRRDNRRDGDRPTGRNGSASAHTLSNKMKGLWSSAMSAGVDATREHRVLDVSQPRPDAASPDTARHDPARHDTARHDAARHDTARHDTARHDAARHDAARHDDGNDDWDDSWDAGWDGIDASTSLDDQGPDRVDPSVSLDDHFVPVAGAARRTGAIDPLLAKLGATAVVLTLLVPLVVGFSSDSGSGDLLAGAELAAQEAAAETPTLDPALDPGLGSGTDQQLAPGSAGSDSPDEPSVTYLVAADLPPAVPVDSGSSDADTSTPSSGDGSSAGNGDVSSAEIASDASTQQSRQSSGSAGVDEIASSAGADSDAERVGPVCAIDYTVVAGDFWIRLADASGVELAELLEANGATVNTPLYPGREICLPAGASTPAPPAATTTTPSASTTPATTPATTATTTPAATATTTPATTVAPPTTQAPAATVAPTPPPGPADIQQIIRDVWPDDLEDRALEIAYRESRFVPTAKNFCCYGLFQIYWTVHRGWLDDIGITDDQQLYDPETNARAALALYERAGGWGPWGF